MSAGMLEGKAAIVSGIGPGMGRAVALACAREGADVALAARRPGRLDAVAAEIEALGRRALRVPTDIADPAQCRALAERTLAEFGRIDALVNNAAAAGADVALADAAPEQIRETLEVNVGGTLAMTQAAIPAMREGGGGSIVMIGSLVVRRVLPGHGPYAASKAALLNAAHTLALELGPDNIRVNTVLPSYIWGGPVRLWFRQLASERGVSEQDVYDEAAAEAALNRIATPEEIAEAVVFFASDRSRAITGQSLDVNCGSFFA